MRADRDIRCQIKAILNVDLHFQCSGADFWDVAVFVGRQNHAHSVAFLHSLIELR